LQKDKYLPNITNNSLDNKYEKILKDFKSQDQIKEILKNDEDFNQEIPKIESYYTEKPFYDFYIYLSSKNNNISECDKISDDEKKKYCHKLFENKNNESKFLVYSKSN
jgi:ribosomal protein S8